MPSKLYVGNLAYAVTNEDLTELFGQVGAVEKAVVVTDKFSGQSRGFGFVEMADQDGATKAIETLNESDLKGRRIKINQARDGGGPRGGGGRRAPRTSWRWRWRRWRLRQSRSRPRRRGRWCRRWRRRAQRQPLVAKLHNNDKAAQASCAAFF